jgi:hypothetical protein
LRGEVDALASIVGWAKRSVPTIRTQLVEH